MRISARIDLTTPRTFRPLGKPAAWSLVVWILGCSIVYYAVFLVKVPAVQRLLNLF